MARFRLRIPLQDVPLEGAAAPLYDLFALTLFWFVGFRIFLLFAKSRRRFFNQPDDGLFVRAVQNLTQLCWLLVFLTSIFISLLELKASPETRLFGVTWHSYHAQLQFQSWMIYDAFFILFHPKSPPSGGAKTTLIHHFVSLVPCLWSTTNWIGHWHGCAACLSEVFLSYCYFAGLVFRCVIILKSSVSDLSGPSWMTCRTWMRLYNLH